jgi:hypothetical protein
VIADSDNGRIRVVAAKTGTFYGQAMTAGDIYSVAGQSSLGSSGDGGPGTKAHLSSPIGIAVDPAGSILTADLKQQPDKGSARLSAGPARIPLAGRP